MAETRPPDAVPARVFFALWPDAAVRASLAAAGAALHRCYGGRRMRPDSLHLTLVFVGQVAGARIPELISMAAGVRVPRFDAIFDKAECWRHNQIGCLGANAAPNNLLVLVRNLEEGLKRLDVPFDHRPYKPHITLLRNADCRREEAVAAGEGKAKNNPAPEAVAWPARDFVLVKSNLRPDGALYEELGRWPLL